MSRACSAGAKCGVRVGLRMGFGVRGLRLGLGLCRDQKEGGAPLRTPSLGPREDV